MASVASDLSVTSAPYGKHPSGAEVTIWTLKNKAPGGIEVKATDYGAILVSVLAPDASGVMSDVVLGYDHLEAWVAGKPWFNSVVGRHANRIAQGKFKLDGQTFQLEQNNLGNNLHSGATGWNSKLFQSRAISGSDAGGLGAYVGVEMTYHSPDGEGGFPGALDVTTSFRLYGGSVNTLHMDFRAQHAATKSDNNKPTIVSMCNHAYWNLNGSDGKDTVLAQHLRVHADAITELDGKDTMLATGRIVPVADTPYDFRTARTIGGEQLHKLDQQLPAPGGYDVNFVLNKEPRAAAAAAAAAEAGASSTEPEADRSVTIDGAEVRATFAARLADPVSGRIMDVYTSAPGIQVYSGNFLDGESLVGRGGVAYPKHAAVCLETQTFPDAISHLDKWDKYNTSPVLRPGQKYKHVVLHRFHTAKKA